MSLTPVRHFFLCLFVFEGKQVQFTEIHLALLGWVPCLSSQEQEYFWKVTLARCQGYMLCHSATYQLNDWFHDWYLSPQGCLNFEISELEMSAFETRQLWLKLANTRNNRLLFSVLIITNFSFFPHSSCVRPVAKIEKYEVWTDHLGDRVSTLS